MSKSARRICQAGLSLAIIVSWFVTASNPVAAGEPEESAKVVPPQAGDTAPDFTLSVLGGDEDETVTLRDYAGKKDVVLVFGSYT